MMIFAACLVTLFSLLGVVLTLVTLPGIWLMVFVALLCEVFLPEMFGWPLLISVVVLGLLAELAEMVAGAAGAGQAGGTRWGMAGALVGSIVGLLAGSVLIPIPIVGSIVGAVIGAGLGTLLAERGTKRTWNDAWRSSRGAMVGKALSIPVKGVFSLAVAMALIIGAWA